MMNSKRITLRRFQTTDVEKVYQVSQEASLGRFLPDQVYRNREEAAETLAYLISSSKDLKNIEKHPYVLGIVLHPDGELIGHVGLSAVDRGLEIRYAIEDKHQGSGYATSAGSKMLQVI